MVLFLGGASTAFAQALNGSITGTVIDNTGGALPGVTVTASQPATGVNRTTVTGNEGVFRFDGLPVGGYSLKLELSGFNALSLTLPTPLAGLEVRNLGKLTMKLGGLEETVQVTAAVTPVQVSETSRQATISGDNIQSLQVKARDVFGLLQTVAGIQDTAQDRAIMTRTSATSVTINGMNSFNKDIRVDGLNIIDEGGCGSVSVNLNMDAVAEMQVITNGYTAENGRNSGGIISMVTKSGTNEFKGATWYNGRRDRFNSLDFFRKINNQAKPLYAINIAGYAFGGPVIIPRLVDSRTSAKKVFFFVSQEQTDDRQASVTTRANLPTALERNGDFSQTFITTGSGANAAYSVGPIFDPLTGKQFPGNKIPAAGTPGCGVQFSCINPVGQALLNLQLMPNGILNLQPGALYSSNWAEDKTPEHTRSNSVLRLDAVLSQKTRASFRTVKDRDDLWAYNGIAPGQMHRALNSPGLVLSSTITQVLTPTVVNEITFGYVHHRYGFSAGNGESTKNTTGGGFDYTQLYAANVLPGVTIPRFAPFGEYSDPPSLPKFGGRQQDQWPYLPQYTTNALNRSNLANYQFDNGPWPRMNLSARVPINDSLSIVKGHHTFKVGFLTEWDEKTEPGSVAYAGSFAFNDDANNPLRTRNGYASLLLGYFTTYTELTARVDKNVRHWQTEAFAQDTWRAGSRVTVDYGLRISHMGNQYEVNDSHTGFYPDQWSAAQAPRVYQLACITANYVNTSSCSSANQRAIDPLNPNVRLPSVYQGNIVPGSGDVLNGVSTEGIPGQKPGVYATFPGLVYAPRFGVAWDINGDGKSALRASTGLFYQAPSSSSGQAFSYNYAGGCPVSCSQVVRWGQFADITDAATRGVQFVQSPDSHDVGGIHVDVPYSFNANVAYQRDIGFNTVAEVAWVANNVYLSGRNVDRNLLPLYVYSDINNVFNNAPVAANVLRARPGMSQYPGEGSVNEFVPGLANQVLKYNAMQVSVNRRLSKGLSMGLAYTLAKGEGYTGYSQYLQQIGGDDLQRQYNWTPTAEDRRHNLVFNYSYNIPTLSKKPIIRQLISDWQVSGLTKLISGAGVTPTCSTNNSGINNTRPSLTDGLDAACQLTGAPVNQNLSQNQDDYATPHFNTDAFAFAQPTNIDPVTGLATVGALGSPGVTRMLRNPTWHEWDLTISRRFGFTAFGRKNSGFRLQYQIYNLFNEVQFTTMNASMAFQGADNATLNSPNVGRYTATIPARIQGLTVRFDW